MDTQLIDDFMRKELGNVCHEVVLGAGAVVCEDMTGLDQLPDRGARLYAIAPRVEAASFPGRVFAVADERARRVGPSERGESDETSVQGDGPGQEVLHGPPGGVPRGPE